MSTHRLENLEDSAVDWPNDSRIHNYIETELEFLSYLSSHDLVDATVAERIGKITSSSSRPMPNVIVEFGFLSDEAVADSICAFTGLSRFATTEITEVAVLDQSVTKKFLQTNQICPYAQDENAIRIATSNALRPQAAIALAFVLSKRLVIKVATSSEMEKLISGLFTETEANDVSASSDLPLSDTDKERLRDFASDAPIVKLLNTIIQRAAESKASDIHIEPFEDRTRVRIRVDGVLRNLQEIDSASYLGVVSRIKILSKLNIAENRLPQDGRMQLAVRGRNIEFRVATSPSVYGESVVLRLLDRNSKILELEDLGFQDNIISRIDHVLRQPNGMFLVSGPTGSGKTTTLYAALLRLNDPSRKIFTIEDPVEYQINGVTQIHTRSQIGLDFAQILRSVLRQDPDVILVGEIRDKETAQIAIQASLTGHLVLSTIHTNSAAATVTRLRNLGIDDHLLASSIRAILAQRLVRRSCAQCSSTGKQASCLYCGGTGFSGRITLSEHLEVDTALATSISIGENEFAIASHLAQQGSDSLQQSGQRLVGSGLTTVAEVSRVLAST